MLRAKIWRWVFRKSATYIEHYVRELPFFFSSYHDCNITTRITEQWRQENSTDLIVIHSSKWKKNNKLSSLIKNTFRNATTGTSEVRAQKFHTDDVTLPRSKLCFWLVVPEWKFASTNQKHYPDLRNDTSSVRNFCPRSSNVSLLGNQRWRQKIVAFISSYKLSRKVIFRALMSESGRWVRTKCLWMISSVKFIPEFGASDQTRNRNTHTLVSNREILRTEL